MATPVEIVQRQIEAYNQRDTERFLNCYHPEAEIFDLTRPQAIFRGTEELRRLYKGIFESSPELKATIHHRMSFGQFVVDDEQVTGSSKFPKGIRIGAVYQIEGELIRKVWFTK